MRSSLQRRLGVTREGDGSLETVKLRLPTVITTELRPNESRYVTLQKECLTPTS